MLRCENVTKEFFAGGRKVEVLKGVNLDVRQGERIAVIGVSGVGKSTLLHILGTLERPTSGTVSYDGRAVSREPDETLAEFRNKSIGFVFQFHHLLPDFTAVENVQIPLLIAGKSKAEAASLAAEMLGKVGLSHREGHRPSELSGGEQQRVALARALVGKPLVLLADEPTGNLDARTGEEIQELLVGLNEQLGVTMVIVTHSAPFAARMHRSLTIAEGRIQEVGPGGLSG
ncbi:MAG: ABC transporter ATP-binding protein [Bdellovibrionota bacterium]